MAPILSTRGITFRTLLFYMILLFLLSLFVLYILFQARFLLAGPQILIAEAYTDTHTERVVTIEGVAKNITHMTLNGRQVYTDTLGNFKEAVVLENGYTIATLQAEDRYGRTTRVNKEFVYTQK